MRRIIIAEPQELVADRLRQAAQDAGIADAVVVSSVEEARVHLDQEATDVLLIGPLLADDEAFEIATEVADSHGIATVVVAPTVNSALLRKAMRAGVADVVSLSDSISEISDAIASAGDTAARWRTATPHPAETPAQEAPRGKIITVFSTKGGVGKTVLSTNLAVVLAKETGKRCVIVDLDLEFGDVGIMLGLRPDHTIADVVQVYDRLDVDLLRGFMVQHSSGLDVLLAPVRPEDAETVSVARTTQILDLLRECYDFIVIDTSPSFSEVVLAALDKSDAIYVITMMDVASIKNTRISLQKLTQLGYDSHRLGIVLNRSDSKVLLQPGEVETAIGAKISVHIPSDRIVPRSVNKGVPVVIDMPKSDVARSIMELARETAGWAAKEADDVA